MMAMVTIVRPLHVDRGHSAPAIGGEPRASPPHPKSHIAQEVPISCGDIDDEWE